MSDRRVAGFVVFTVAMAAGVSAYVMFRTHASGGPASVPEPGIRASTNQSANNAALMSAIRDHDHVYYRSARREEFGRVVVADLRAPNDRRVLTPLVCDRVDFGVDRGICLKDTRGPAGPATTATIVDRDFHTIGLVQLPGVPIRARLSPDERLAAATVFVTGERYDADFTTRTTLIDTHTGAAVSDLEQFATTRDGRRYSRVDFNFWGVTFARDSRRFFATLGFTGTRLLVAGDDDGRTLRVMRDDVECPSLSPDERHIAFKSRAPGQQGWRLHVMNVDGSGEWAIDGETRSIDDQVEWLDPGHVLYQFVAERGLPEQAMNVWQSPASPGDVTPPSIFIHGANSPAVVRR
jgi:hypothetical protein